MRVCIPALVIFYANCIFPESYCIVMRGLSGSTVFFHIILRTASFSKKKIMNLKYFNV